MAFDDKFREIPCLLPFYYLWPDRCGDIATLESFRRYWSRIFFSMSGFGIPNVLSPPIFQPDFKFLNPFNFILRYDNTPLVNTIRKYWNAEEHPIKSNEGEPRLLIVAMDLQDATTVTFDSYAKQNDELMSIYGDEEENTRHVIRYNDGIKMEHLLTTFSSHLRHKFAQLPVTTTRIENGNHSIAKEYLRPFMDGFYLCNTPLREVLQAHRDYWYGIRKISYFDVPSLEIFIGDLYPTMEKGIPVDPDSINNRVQNVLFHDKSKYDEKVTTMISDYIHVIKVLMQIANERGISDSEIYSRLNCDMEAKIVNSDRREKTRCVKDLIQGRVNVRKI